MTTETKPRILVVNEQVEIIINRNGNNLFDYLRKELFCKADVDYDGRVVAASRNPLDYDVAIIDASDDCIVDGIHSLSEFMRLKNPDIIIIGTSVQGRNFKEDGLAKQMYDERIAFSGEAFEEIKKKLTKYGYSFPSGTRVEARS